MRKLRLAYFHTLQSGFFNFGKSAKRRTPSLANLTCWLQIYEDPFFQKTVNVCFCTSVLNHVLGHNAKSKDFPTIKMKLLKTLYWVQLQEILNPTNTCSCVLVTRASPCHLDLTKFLKRKGLCLLNTFSKEKKIKLYFAYSTYIYSKIQIIDVIICF